MRKNSQSGMSLLTVLMLSALTGLLAVSFARTFKFTLQSTKHTELDGELETMREALNLSMSCILTKIECTSAGQFVNMLRIDGTVLYPTQDKPKGVKVGSWNYRVKCKSVNKPTFEYARFSGGTFDQDPLTGKNAEWKPLFETASGPCESSSSMTACPPGRYVSSIQANGTVQCRPLPACPIGQFLKGVTAAGAAKCGDFSTCPAGSYWAGYNASGDVVCRSWTTGLRMVRSSCQNIPGHGRACNCPGNSFLVTFTPGTPFHCTCCNFVAVRE